MGVNTKIIKRRIKSVRNTRKITKAMEMVAAAKMRRAVESALQTRTYAKLAWDLLVTLSKTQKTAVPLLEVRPVQRLLIILVTSNRGLCGSFNSNIIRKIAEQVQNPANIGRQRAGGKDILPAEKIEVDVIGVGKKGADFAKKMKYNLIASYSHFSDTPTFEDVSGIGREAVKEYETKKYDKIVVAYTDYQSAIRQTPKLRQVLPISEHDLEKMISELGENKMMPEKPKLNVEVMEEYLMEPSRTAVLNIILPRLVQTQIFQAVLESSASEHSSRMLAMRNASDAATDMIAELNLNFNKARQAGITQEIAEISGGAAALG